MTHSEYHNIKEKIQVFYEEYNEYKRIIITAKPIVL